MRTFIICLLVLIPAFVSAQFNLNDGLVGSWVVDKVKTSDDGLNQLLQIEQQKVDAVVDFGKNKTAKLIFGKDAFNATYTIKNDIITVVNKNVTELNNVDIKGSMAGKNDLTLTLPSDLTKSLISLSLKEYVKYGGEPFIVKMIEATLKDSDVSAIVTLKRK